MAVAWKDSIPIDGRGRVEIEQALVEMVEQLEKMDYRLKNRTDHEVWKLFQKKHDEITKMESDIQRLLENK